MTTVANQAVSGDTVSGKVAAGKKSNIGNRATFLGGSRPGTTASGVYAGTLGGSLGPGSGLPSESAAPLTKIEKAK